MVESHLRKPSSSFEKLLDRVTFRIQSNKNDGDSLRAFGAPLEYWANGGCVDGLFTCGGLALVLCRIVLS